MVTHNCIILKNVAIGYRGIPFLSDINFSLKKGEFTALLGQNGSGKTTLFKTILRIIPLIRGTILYDNNQFPKFGYVPQHQYLDEIYPFTATEVVLMGTFGKTKPFKLTHKKDRVWVEQCLKDVGMLNFKKELFSELSGGQKQRILIARALATQPDILLLDEPVTGIDFAAQKMIMKLISQLHKKHQLTIVMVTHALQNLPKCINKVIWIQDKKVNLRNIEEFSVNENVYRVPF